MPIQIWSHQPPRRWWDAVHATEPWQDLVGVGLALTPEHLVEAYRGGLFPMGLGRDGGSPMGWWSPDPRGVLLPGDLRVSHSLRKSARAYTVTTDRMFEDVLHACADPSREGRWITPAIAQAYLALHEAGVAHSVEVWSAQRELVGGLYGVSIGGLFAGESMFHRARDASKVALMALVDLLFADGDERRLVDTQWPTDHLASLGIVAVRRNDYLRRLSSALTVPAPAWGRN